MRSKENDHKFKYSLMSYQADDSRSSFASLADFYSQENSQREQKVETKERKDALPSRSSSSMSQNSSTGSINQVELMSQRMNEEDKRIHDRMDSNEDVHPICSVDVANIGLSCADYRYRENGVVVMKALNRYYLLLCMCVSYFCMSDLLMSIRFLLFLSRVLKLVKLLLTVCLEWNLLCTM